MLPKTGASRAPSWDPVRCHGPYFAEDLATARGTRKLAHYQRAKHPDNHVEKYIQRLTGKALVASPARDGHGPL
ncbi:hypothetical protein L1887_54880 [Cichorium endivia]|nr:hypothetical protein L1887_54880 [Cichorium endivia]